MNRWVLVINDSVAYEFASEEEGLAYLAKWCINEARGMGNDTFASEMEKTEAYGEICRLYFAEYHMECAVCLPLTQPEEI